MNNSKIKISTVLFDLDGTLVDTAPDLASALNRTLENNNRPTLPYEVIRPMASHGAKGLLKLGFNIDEHHQTFTELREQLLSTYRQHLCIATKLFPQIEELLNYINTHNLNWGIVTNKPAWLTEPLLKQLRLFSEAGCVVSGDSVAKAKPHPDSLLHACKLLNSQPHACVYLGDAQRDIEAGIRAGMHTLIARYGYIAESDNPELWNANAMINQPIELIDWIKQQNAFHA